MFYLNSENQLIEHIKSCKKAIYIYGAGEIGKLVEKRIKSKGCAGAKFCITKNDNNSCAVEITQVPSDALIIVSVKPQFREEICHTLASCGFDDYIVITDKLIAIMQRNDRIKLKFQTHIVEHCNLNCRGCYHFSCLAKEKCLDIHEYEKDIKRLSELFKGQCEEIMLLGGEPLLHPLIADFFHITRRYFKEGVIKVLSNGTKLLSMNVDFWKGLKDCDIELWVTKYPIDFNYCEAEKVAADHEVAIHYFNIEPIKTMGYQPLSFEGKQPWAENYYSCYRANECIDLKHGKLFACILPAEIETFNTYFGKNIVQDENDGIDIYKAKDATEILDFLDKPMRFCRYCDRTDVKTSGIQWGVTKREIQEWGY